MELSEAIDRIIQEFGKDIIAEKRFVYMIADYFSFRDNPAEKRVLSALVNDGYTARLLNLNEGIDVSIITNQIVEEVCRNYGFREDLVLKLTKRIIRSLGLDASKDLIITNPSEKKMSINNQTIVKDTIYPEDYIMSLYPVLFENVPHHAHVDFDVFRNKLKLDSDEAFRLFRFLKGMGVYKYNIYSDDYDIAVDTKNSLRKMYRSYVFQLGVLEIPLSKVRSLKRTYLESIIKKLYKNKFISVEEINAELPSFDNNREYSRKLLYLLQRLNVIDNRGCSLKPYLTPEAMINTIITKIIEPWSQIIFPSGNTIRKSTLESIINILVKKGSISLEQIISELNESNNKKEEIALELFYILEKMKFIDDKGRNLNIYLTPKVIVEKVIKNLL